MLTYRRSRGNPSSLICIIIVLGKIIENSSGQVLPYAKITPGKLFLFFNLPFNFKEIFTKWNLLMYFAFRKVSNLIFIEEKCLNPCRKNPMLSASIVLEEHVWPCKNKSRLFQLCFEFKLDQIFSSNVFDRWPTLQTKHYSR